MSQMAVDQASGLRRLFNAPPPEVMAVIPCGADTLGWTAVQLTARARAGVRMCVLDEWQTWGSLADCLGHPPQHDLLAAVTGRLRLEQCVEAVLGGLDLIGVGQLAPMLGGEAQLTERALECLRGLQPGYEEWLISARPCGVGDPSWLACAAPRVLLLTDDHKQSVTSAWTTLQTLGRAAPTARFAVCHVGGEGVRAAAAFAALAERRLSRFVEPVASLGEALLMQPAAQGGQAEEFLRRMQAGLMRQAPGLKARVKA